MTVLPYLVSSNCKKMYFRIRKKLLGIMGLQHSLEHLKKISDELLESFKADFSNLDENEYIKVAKFVSWEGGGDILRFRFLNRNFTLSREIMIYGGVVVYRTHEETFNINSFNHVEAILLSELDIIQFSQGYIRFRVNKKTTHPYFGKGYDTTLIQSFTAQYFNELAGFMKNREDMYMKDLSPIKS